tara:strand:- start:15 stop:2114 length:2100 start_codon:yes stop_codon:yes gene_type:complete
MAQNLVINILAKDKTKQAFGVLKTRLGVLKQSIFSVQSALVGIGAGLVVRNLVNTGKELENLRTRLKFLLKDTNEGAKAFDNMVKFASKVPFSLEEIQSGSGILATVTDNADDLQKMLQITGNVAAVTGLDFRTASEQIQRSFSAGIGAADLFREKGVRNMLGFKAGATVSIEETVQAFEKVFGKGGRFGNATDELAQTFAGTLSMIGDKIFNFKKVLLEAGFFEELKKQFGDLDKFLSDNAKRLDEIATTVGKNLAQAVTGAVSVGQDLIPTLQKIGSILKSIKDGFMSLPEFVREVGLVGAFLFGKKGAVALAGVSFIIDKINDFIKDTKTQAGIIDVNNLDDVEKRLAIINDRLKNRNQIITETITLNNGVTHEVQTQHALSDETIKLLEKEKKQLQTILFLKNKESTNQFELHRGLKSISVTQEEVKEKVKKTLDLRKHMQEIIKNAENKEMEKQLFIQTEINKKKREFNRIVTEAENKIKNQKTTTEQVTEQIKQQNEQFSISREITNVVNKSVQGVSRGFAEALVLGKNLNMTMKELAQSILVDIVAKTIERIALKQIEKFLDAISVDKEATKENLIRKQNTELKRQIALQMFLNAIGGGSGGGGIPFMAKGGAVSKGQPIVVGENGAEMFIPNSSGQITQSARGTGGGAVNVNFTINTIDSRGFDEALITNRATITGIINSALAEKGRSELV